MDVLTSRLGRVTPLLMAVALAVAALACTAADEDSGTDAGSAVGSGTPGGPGGTPVASTPIGVGAVGDATPGGVDGTPAPGAPTGVGGPTGGSGVVGGDVEYVRRPAPIESVAVRVAESMPPQHFVDVVSGLPSGCATFDDYEVTREGDTVSVMVWNREPSPDSNVACTMVYGFVEHSIALGSDFVAGRTYTVAVNDRSTNFTAQ